MSERTPFAELAPGRPVALLAPLWTPKAIFHDERYCFWGNGEDDARWQGRIMDLAGTDAPWKFNLTATRCGTLLRANWWLEPKDHTQADYDGRYRHPTSLVELRFDQARSFARPCRRCWPDAPSPT